MTILKALRSEILWVVEQNEPILYSDLAEQVEHLADNAKQVSNLVYNMCKSGVLARDDENRLVLPPEAQDSPSPLPTACPAAPASADATDAQVAKLMDAIRPERSTAATEPADESDDTDHDPGLDDDCAWYSERYVLDVLEDQERVAQDALDRYLMSVGDPTIIECLRAPRDAARAAIEAIVDDGRGPRQEISK